MKRFMAVAAGIVLCLLVLAPSISAQTAAKNFGFIQGNIWYSKDPFYDGDKIRIYSGVVNSTGEDITGTVEFYDNTTLIGKTDFSAVGNGTLQQVWTDWVATKGDHTISAKIIQAKIAKVGGGSEAVTITNNASGADTRAVVLDPVVVAAKKAAEAAAAAAAAASAPSSTLTSILQNASPAVQQAASTTAVVAQNVVQAINNFADAQALKLDAKGQQLQDEIAQLKAQQAAVEAGDQQIADLQNATTTVAGQPEPAGEAGQQVAGEATSKPVAAQTETAKPWAISQTSTSSAAIKKQELSRSILVKEFYLAMVSTMSYILKHRLLMYFVLLVVVYNLLKFMFRRLFGRRKRAY